jgi:hypothetical protein
MNFDPFVTVHAQDRNDIARAMSVTVGVQACSPAGRGRPGRSRRTRAPRHPSPPRSASGSGSSAASSAWCASVPSARGAVYRPGAGRWWPPICLPAVSRRRRRRRARRTAAGSSPARAASAPTASRRHTQCRPAEESAPQRLSGRTSVVAGAWPSRSLVAALSGRDRLRQSAALGHRQLHRPGLSSDQSAAG